MMGAWRLGSAVAIVLRRTLLSLDGRTGVSSGNGDQSFRFAMVKAIALREDDLAWRLIADLARREIDIHVVVDLLERAALYEIEPGGDPESGGTEPKSVRIAGSFILLPESVYDLSQLREPTPRVVLLPELRQRVRLVGKVTVSLDHVAILANDDPGIGFRCQEEAWEDPETDGINEPMVDSFESDDTASSGSAFETPTVSNNAQPGFSGSGPSEARKEPWKRWHSDARFLGYLVIGLAENPRAKTRMEDLVSAALAACSLAGLPNVQAHLVHGVSATTRNVAKNMETPVEAALLQVLVDANLARSTRARGREGKVSVSDVAQDLVDAAAKAGRAGLAAKSLQRLLQPFLST